MRPVTKSLLLFMSLTMAAGAVVAEWGMPGPGWMGYSQQSRPAPYPYYGGGRYYQPAPVQRQSFASPSGWGNMMPWSGGQARQPVYQPQRQSGTMMMPGMEEGIRTMMAPGKIMAEEATPSMVMTPTWRR